MKIKKRIIQYLKENGISIEKISSDTRINIRKFDEKSRLDLNAEEFLAICVYLEVDPKQFY